MEGVDGPHSGRHKEAAGRKALSVLDSKGLVELAHSDRDCWGEPPSKNRQTCPSKVPSIAGSLTDMGRIDIEMVTRSNPEAAMPWRSLMDEHHYLGKGKRRSTTE